MILPALLIGGGMILAGGVTLRQALAAKREHQRLLDTPTSRVGALVEGPAEVTGRAIALQRTRAAWSGQESAHSRYVIEERVQNGKHSHWVTRKQWADPPRFLVDDGSGKALVQAEVADLDLPVTYTAESSFGKDPPAEVLETLRAQDIAFEGWFGANKRMRFTETTIPAGTTVFVSGQALRANEARGTGAQYALTVGDDTPLLVTTKSEEDELAMLSRKARNGRIGAVALLAIGGIVAFVGAIGYTK